MHRTLGRHLLSLVAAAVVYFAPSTAWPQKPVAHPSNAVVARVNGVPITEDQLAEETEVLYPSHSGHGGLQPGKLKELRAKALDELVVEELAYQDAVKRNLVVPMAQVRVERTRLRQKYGPADFDATLRASGLTAQEYLRQLQRRMTLERIFRQNVAVPSRVSRQEVRAYYQNNLKKFRRPEQVRARLFLAGVKTGATPAEEKQAQQKAEMVYRELRAGGDFADLARRYSDDFYAIKGGDLGWMHRGRWDPEFEPLAFKLKPGQYSEPFRTPYGYNILKVEAYEPGRQMQFDSIEAILKSDLEKEKYMKIRQAWVASLKKGAQIEFLDPEAKQAATTLQSSH